MLLKFKRILLFQNTLYRGQPHRMARAISHIGASLKNEATSTRPGTQPTIQMGWTVRSCSWLRPTNRSQWSSTNLRSGPRTSTRRWSYSGMVFTIYMYIYVDRVINDRTHRLLNRYHMWLTKNVTYFTSNKYADVMIKLVLSDNQTTTMHMSNNIS